MVKHYYVAYYGDTEFEFLSEHPAGSAANLEDATRRARQRFGRLHNTISGIHLRPEVEEAPIGIIPPKDLTLTAAERDMIAEAIRAGKITRIGAKLNGTMCVFAVKDAHGWSRRELDQAITDAFFSGR